MPGRCRGRPRPHSEWVADGLSGPVSRRRRTRLHEQSGRGSCTARRWPRGYHIGGVAAVGRPAPRSPYKMPGPAAWPSASPHRAMGTSRRPTRASRRRPPAHGEYASARRLATPVVSYSISSRRRDVEAREAPVSSATTCRRRRPDGLQRRSADVDPDRDLGGQTHASFEPEADVRNLRERMRTARTGSGDGMASSTGRSPIVTSGLGIGPRPSASALAAEGAAVSSTNRRRARRHRRRAVERTKRSRGEIRGPRSARSPLAHHDDAASWGRGGRVEAAVDAG